MATSSIKADQKEVAIEQRDLQIDVIDEGQRRATVALPPARDMRELHGRPVRARRVAFETEMLSDLEQRAIEAEFERLHAQYERFKTAPTFLSRLSLLARLSGRSRLALELAESAAQLGSSPEIKFKLADEQLGSKEVEGTRLLVELAAEGYVPASLRLVERALLREDWDQAQRLTGELLDSDYQDWRIHLVAGAIALNLGHYAQAVHHFRIAQQERPRSAAISQNIAIAQYALGNTKQAIQAARRSIALNPFKESALVFLADVLTNERIAAGVPIRLFDRFLEHRPDSQAIAGRVANLYLLTGDAPRGIDVLRKLQSEQRSPALLNNIGVLYWSQKNLGTAQRYFVAAIKELAADSPHAALVTANAVTVLLEAGEFKNVEQITASILDGLEVRAAVSDRHLSRIFGVRTEALFRQRNYGKAIPLAEMALRQQDAYPRLRAMLASQLVCYYALVEGNYEIALTWARQEVDSSRMVGEDVVLNTALNNLSFILLELGRSDEARKYIETLRSDLGDSAIVLATRGLYQIRAGAMSRGEANYRKAIRISADSALAESLRQKFNLELAKYWKTRDRAKAMRFARAAQKVKRSETGWDHRKMRADINRILEELAH